MTATFDYLNLYDLPEISFVAGSDQELVFNIYTSACALVDLSGATVTWKMTRFGNQSTALLTKTGSLTGSPVNQFIVKIDDGDTSGSYGKFLHMYSVADASGSILRPSAGIINLVAYPS